MHQPVQCKSMKKALQDPGVCFLVINDLYSNFIVTHLQPAWKKKKKRPFSPTATLESSHITKKKKGT